MNIRTVSDRIKRIFNKVAGPTASFIVKLLRNSVLILLLVIFASIIYNFRNTESSTVTALMAQASLSKEYKGVFIRDERPVTYSGGGALSYDVADGGRLGCGSTIAKVYPSDEQISINRELENLRADLAILEKIQNPGTIESAQPSTLSESINESYRRLIYSRDMRDYENLKKYADTLDIHLSTYQIITNEVENFNQEISDINTKIAELQARTQQPAEIIKSDRSAYFVSYCDGYENRLTADVLSTITAEQVNSITDARENDPTIVGKLVNGYGWHLAVVADNSKKQYEIGDSLQLRFEVSADLYDAVITDIHGEPSQSVIILSCDSINYDLVQHRAANVELVKGEYEGLKVPREAIRFSEITETVTNEDGTESEKTVSCKGVYVIKGEQQVFKKIDVVYEGGDYVLSAVHTGDGDYLTLYDDIITEGE